MKRHLPAAVVLIALSACAGEDSAKTVPTRAPRAAATDEASPDLPKAHDFTLETFQGTTFTLSDHFGELPIVLNFWAPW